MAGRAKRGCNGWKGKTRRHGGHRLLRFQPCTPVSGRSLEGQACNRDFLPIEARQVAPSQGFALYLLATTLHIEM